MFFYEVFNKFFLAMMLMISSVAMSQDFNAKCGENSAISPYDVTFSKDRATGYFIFDKTQLYKLNLIEKNEADYVYNANLEIEAGGMDFLFLKIKFNSQDLTFTAEARRSKVKFNYEAKCKSSNENFMMLIDGLQRKKDSMPVPE